MRKFILVILFFLIIAITYSSQHVEAFDYSTQQSDFYALSDETNVVAIDGEYTRFTMIDDYAKSRIVYGDKDQDYRVNLASFTLKITPEAIEDNGRITVTFAENRNIQPLIGNSEGISFVIRLIEEGSEVEIAILDANNGELIEEMKGVQWAYLGSEETNWDNGIIGNLSGSNGSVKDSELTLRFVNDSASSGGTTFRPAMGTGSLGVAI